MLRPLRMGEVAATSEMQMLQQHEEEVQEQSNGSAAGVVVRWERFLPRMVLRVLLVEADDSTRQIIAALLRKCGYKGFPSSFLFPKFLISNAIKLLRHTCHKSTHPRVKNNKSGERNGLSGSVRWF